MSFVPLGSHGNMAATVLPPQFSRTIGRKQMPKMCLALEGSAESPSAFVR